MAISATAGTLLYIGTAGFVPSPDNDASAYEADSYTAVGATETFGEFGDESNNIELLLIADARVRNIKGARNAGVMTITCALDDQDAGQLAMIAAEASTLNHPFKLVYNNRATTNGTGAIRYFRGLVMSKRENPAGADDIPRITFNVGINTAITSVVAT